MISRREILVALSLSVLTVPQWALAQEKRSFWRIGFLTQNSQQAAARFIDEFRRGLRKGGYAEGKDYALEERNAEGRDALLPGLAAELVRLNVDVILAVTTNAASAAHAATATIPIVFVAVSDPVASGFAQSLARPNRNMTGLSNFAVDLGPKRLELLKQAVPMLSRVAFLVNPDNRLTALSVPRMRSAAGVLGMRISTVSWNGVTDINTMMKEVAREGTKAVVLGGDPYHYEHKKQIVDAAIKHRIALVSPFREYTVAGGLMSYGTSIGAQFLQAAIYVDKILKGSKPGELPIEQPAKFELVLNVRSARSLGLELPPELLLRADELIQ